MTVQTSPLSTMLITAGTGQKLPLGGIYRGRAVFLVCGGPSLAGMPLHWLNRRGIVSMGINNSWLLHRPQLWVACDAPERFADVGWKDPGIMKFSTTGHLNARLRVQKPDGTFEPSKLLARHCPNTYFVPAASDFDHRSFLDGQRLCVGQKTDTPDSLGVKGCRSTMLLALHLCYHLGFRRVYIVGADFNMTTEQPYAFGETKDASGVKGNNSTYRVLNQRFAAMAPHFAERGFRVLNCTPGGNLTAFERMPFADAVREAGPECRQKVTAAGWYHPPAPPKAVAV